MVQPRKVKCGPGSGNANPPGSAAPSACRLEEADEKPTAQARSAVTGSGFLLATFSRIQILVRSSGRSFFSMNRAHVHTGPTPGSWEPRWTHQVADGRRLGPEAEPLQGR